MYKDMIIDYTLREVLDSRGFPTIEATIILEDGIYGRAMVPSGASTGAHEAIEKRDQDNPRFLKRGVQNIIKTIDEVLSENLIGMDVTNQRLIDTTLNELDGTSQKAKFGANAILAISLACADAGARLLGQPLYRYLGGVGAYTLPIPLMNILNGGVHADNALDIQELMIVPHGAETFFDALRWGSEIYHTLKRILSDAGYSTNVGDEGGFAPAVESTREALDLTLRAIEAAGYNPGDQVALALDVAATELFRKNYYHLEGKAMSQEDMVCYYADLVRDYPIVSIEDGMAEDDWEGWKILTSSIGDSVQLVGDDVFVTNPSRIEDGINRGVANAVLIKPNQIGTLTETIQAIELAHRGGYRTVVSHRSGETEDTFIADLAVAVNSGQIKTGAPCRSERTAKYNQLLRIESDLQDIALFPSGLFA